MDKWQQDYRMKHHNRRLKRIRREVSGIDHFHPTLQVRPSPPKHKKKQQQSKPWMEWQRDIHLVDDEIQRAREGRAGWVFANDPNDLSYLVSMANIENRAKEEAGVLLRSATTIVASSITTPRNTTTTTTISKASFLIPTPPTEERKRRARKKKRRRCRKKNRHQRLVVLFPRSSSLLSETTTTTTAADVLVTDVLSTDVLSTDVLSTDVLRRRRLNQVDESDNILRLEVKLDRYTRDARRRRDEKSSSKLVGRRNKPLPTPPSVRRGHLRRTMLPVS
jgi:hypothetical protein